MKVLARDYEIVYEKGILEDAAQYPDSDNADTLALEVCIIMCVPNPIDQPDESN